MNMCNAEATTIRFGQSTYIVGESSGVVRVVLLLSNPLTNVNVTFNISEVVGGTASSK